jgi:hypothetical protein
VASELDVLNKVEYRSTAIWFPVLSSAELWACLERHVLRSEAPPCRGECLGSTSLTPHVHWERMPLLSACNIRRSLPPVSDSSERVDVAVRLLGAFHKGVAAAQDAWLGARRLRHLLSAARLALSVNDEGQAAPPAAYGQFVQRVITAVNVQGGLAGLAPTAPVPPGALLMAEWAVSMEKEAAAPDPRWGFSRVADAVTAQAVADLVSTARAVLQRAAKQPADPERCPICDGSVPFSGPGEAKCASGDRLSTRGLARLRAACAPLTTVRRAVSAQLPSRRRCVGPCVPLVRRTCSRRLVRYAVCPRGRSRFLTRAMAHCAGAPQFKWSSVLPGGVCPLCATELVAV